MNTLTIGIDNDALKDKVIWLLKHFEDDGLEIINNEDLEDLKAIAEVANEESIPFDDYKDK